MCTQRPWNTQDSCLRSQHQPRHHHGSHLSTTKAADKSRHCRHQMHNRSARNSDDSWNTEACSFRRSRYHFHPRSGHHHCIVGPHRCQTNRHQNCSRGQMYNYLLEHTQGTPCHHSPCLTRSRCGLRHCRLAQSRYHCRTHDCHSHCCEGTEDPGHNADSHGSHRHQCTFRRHSGGHRGMTAVHTVLQSIRRQNSRRDVCTHHQHHMAHNLLHSRHRIHRRF
mmetsp:Transcript_45263/g.108180  ORF Transcript_45263/g.108180 Transcript_45263/m.108180 type:complete len:222 (-) Transcript_45263:3820-4485(-)